MAYEYALRGCLEFMLSYMRFAGERLIKIHVLYMALMALRETTEDSTEFTPGRCRDDRSLWNSIPFAIQLSGSRGQLMNSTATIVSSNCATTVG